MTDTEQKAIEMLRKDLESAYNKKTLFVETTYNALDITLNLIQKQDTEINKLNHVIDRIIEYIFDTTYMDLEECEFEDKNNIKCIKDCGKCIKEYFMKEDK